MARFTYEDADGTMRIKAWALPLGVAAICLPIIGAFGITSQGPAIAVATAALVGVGLIVVAVRSRPLGPMEVAAAGDGKRRVLVLATSEVADAAAARVAELAAGADDVRIVMPAPTGRFDRWFDAEDKARGEAQDWLARSAGALTVRGLPVSGSVGDADPVQAVADELRTFAANEIVVVAPERERKRVEKLRHSVALPLTRVTES